jgi:ketosteroid isomerase-like protein
MTLRTAVRLGGILAALATPAALSAQDDAVAAVGRLEEELNTALVKCDAAALDRLWAAEMTFVFPNGRVATKTERMAGLKRCTPGSPASDLESVQTKAFGDAAVAVVTTKWSGSAEGKPVNARFRATHVWTRRAGQWALVAAHVSQVKE